METYDIAVIGAGPGGYPAAIRAAQLGASVAIVEKEMLGGTCLNWGCIPTKFLIGCASLYEAMRHADRFGIVAPPVTADYASMVGGKDRVVENLRNGVAGLLRGNGVTVLAGEASFEGRQRIAVEGQKRKIRIQAGRTIIAAGSVSSLPGFLPRHPRVVESRGFLARTELPERVLVLGGGVIGCELACLLAQLGVRTTVVEMLPDIIGPLDPDVRRELRRSMEADLGIRILTGAPLERITATREGVSGAAGTERIEADLLLAAVGRAPATRGLNLKAAGIETAKSGHIPVDAQCRTSAAGIYAIGDVTEGPQLAHRATSDGITAAEHACGNAKAVRETVVPSCVFTSPEIGSAGISEQEAKDRGMAVKVGKFPFLALGKALATGHTRGFVKWIADAQTDQLLGAHAVGAHATDLIAEATLAIRSEQTAGELARTIHAHPTLAEAWAEAAEAIYGRSIHVIGRRK